MSSSLPAFPDVLPYSAWAAGDTAAGAEFGIGDDDPIVRLGDGRAHCKACDVVFKTVHIARKHVTQVHMSAAIQCILCTRVYKGEKGFSMHLIRVHNLRGVKDPVQNYGKVMQGDV